MKGRNDKHEKGEVEQRGERKESNSGSICYILPQ